MKLEDIAKMTIDEVAAELEKIQKLEEMQKTAILEEKENIVIIEPPKIEPMVDAEVIEFGSELLFLQSLKERIYVLFEGLNSQDTTNINLRLELTIKFLEFLLANVEHRLKNLSK